MRSFKVLIFFFSHREIIYQMEKLSGSALNQVCSLIMQQRAGCELLATSRSACRFRSTLQSQIISTGTVLFTLICQQDHDHHHRQRWRLLRSQALVSFISATSSFEKNTTQQVIRLIGSSALRPAPVLIII